MLRHRPPTTIAERVTILERASAGETDAMIAASLGCSIWTVRKWRRRGQHQGRAGLIPRRGRPATEPLSTVPQPLRDALSCRDCTLVQAQQALRGSPLGTSVSRA